MRPNGEVRSGSRHEDRRYNATCGGGPSQRAAMATHPPMATLYRVDDRSLLISVIGGEGAFLNPADILDGLSAEQASAKSHGLPHSIADIVAHVLHWQEWANGCAVAGFTGIAEHAADGWPAVSADDWDRLRSRFVASIEGAKRIATESPSLGERLLPLGVEKPESLAGWSRGSGLLTVAVHTAHHLGQIITIRQLMGLWPPPGGTITW